MSSSAPNASSTGTGSVPQPSTSTSSGGGAGGDTNPSDGGTGGSDEPPEVTGTPIVYVAGYGAFPITTYDLDKATGALTQRGETADGGDSPSYLTITPNKKFLLAANEVDGQTGGLTSLAIADDGSLTPINHVSGSDGGFTFVGVDPTGQFAFGASYNGGSLSIFPLAEDGTLGEQSDNVDFGDMANTHSVGFAPEGVFALVPNKGNDEVALLLIGDDGTLTPNSPAQVSGDDGPRHIAVRDDGKFAYVINELGNSVTQFSLADGILTKGATVSSLPDDFNGQSTGAHIELSPDGRFVYASNRGHDSIVAFEADGVTGALTLLEHEPAGGRTPRDFEMDPAGDVLIVATEDSAKVTVLRIEADGKLTPLGESIDTLPRPSAVQMLYLQQ